MIMRTHSVARLRAEVVTSSGCTTFSSSMLLTVPCTHRSRAHQTLSHMSKAILT